MYWIGLVLLIALGFFVEETGRKPIKRDENKHIIQGEQNQEESSNR